MSRGRRIVLTVLAVLVVTAIAAAFVVVPRWYAETGQSSVREETPAAPAVPKIKARLFYVAEDGLGLVAVEREVPIGEGTVEQARRIVLAQLDPPPKPFMTSIPAGTRLRALYVDSGGKAYVDLSAEVTSAHTGGALEEILTVYSIVNALTVNLAAVKAVQILVDGREVDTLAGHVDLRRPLAKGLVWIQETPKPDKS